VVAAVVDTVNVAVCAVVPLKFVNEAGERLHVAGSLAAVGVMAQVSATVPVNPPDGVTLIVEVLPVVAPGLTVMAPLWPGRKTGWPEQADRCEPKLHTGLTACGPFPWQIR
jgi:hypothetical protein